MFIWVRLSLTGVLSEFIFFASPILLPLLFNLHFLLQQKIQSQAFVNVKILIYLFRKSSNLEEFIKKYSSSLLFARNEHNYIHLNTGEHIPIIKLYKLISKLIYSII